MRAPALLLCLLPALALSQGASLGHLARRGLEFRPAPRPLPLPEPTLSDKKFQVLHADSSDRDENDNVRASGHVHFMYRGYEVFAEVVRGNLRTKIFELGGPVRLAGKGRTVEGERVIINFEEETYQTEESRTVIEPASSGARLKGPLYLTSQRLGGSSSQLLADEITCTTCDRKDPHFHLEAKATHLKVRDRLVLTNPRLKVRGRTILQLPTLTIPMSEQGERYTPTIGSSRDEGIYVLNRYTFPSRRDFVTGRFDLFTKLGIGLGTDFRYGNAADYGLARAYGILGSASSRLLSWEHRGSMSGGLLNIGSELQSNNYLSTPGTQVWNTRTSWTKRTETGTIRVNWNRNSSLNSGFRFTNSNLSLAHQNQWSRSLRTSLDLILSGSESRGSTSAFSTKREQLDLRFSGTRQFSTSELELIYQRAIPLETTANFFSASDRTPLLTWRTEASRWNNEAFARQWPLRAEVSVGELGDRASQRVTRTAMDFNLSKSLGSKAFLNSRFRQSLYSNDTAQFVVGLDGGIQWKLARKTTVDLHHNYLQAEGYTPVSIDSTGKTNQTRLDVLSEFGRGFRAGLQTGYDFRAKERQLAPWQTLGLRFDYVPHRDLYLRSNTTYDTQRAKWLNVRLDGGYRFGPENFINFGTRYDAERHTWGNVNVYLEGLKMRNWRLSALASYNGYLKKFESRQLQAILDMHCSELIFQVTDHRVGFRSGTEFGLFLRIKALPFATPFGIGRQGQAIGTGSGFGN